MESEKTLRNNKGKTSHVYPGHVKERIVKELESDQISVQEAIHKYQVARTTLKKWVRTYGHGATTPDASQHAPTLYKRQIINEIETGKLTFLEALKKYKISESTLYSWRKKYSNDIVSVKTTDNMKKNEESNPSSTESKQFEELKLKIIALETLIDIAEKEFNIPIRKKCGSKQ